MEGVWRVIDAGGRWPRPAHQARVVLRVEGREAVGFSLGLVELLPTADEDSIIGHLGPDLMAEDFDEDEALRRLLAEPDRPLGEALLDQTVVAGIGTIYLAETCFLQGAHPLGPVSAVKDPARLLRRAHLLLRNGVYYGRPTTAGDRRGTVWVFRRHGRSCERCGTTIEAGEVGGKGRERTTYWCPSCQVPLTAARATLFDRGDSVGSWRPQVSLSALSRCRRRARVEQPYATPRATKNDTSRDQV